MNRPTPPGRATGAPPNGSSTPRREHGNFVGSRNGPYQRPTDFFRPGFNDGAWGEMPVPGLWELNGYGDPQYLNIGYPWREQFSNNPPYVPVKENHVGSYRREIEIPASWSDKQVIAHFGSVTSNIYLWVNGKFVGSQRGFETRGRIRRHEICQARQEPLRLPGLPLVRRHLLEDQDFFRLSGVGRDCYLYARDKRHIADVRLDATLSENYTRRPARRGAGSARSGQRLHGGRLTLTAPDGKAVAFRNGETFRYDSPSRARRREGAAVVGGDSRALMVSQ